MCMTNRREFLQAITALAVAPSLPAAAGKSLPAYGVDLGAGDYTIEGWYRLPAGNMQELRITKGVARYAASGSRRNGDLLHVFQVGRR